MQESLRLPESLVNEIVLKIDERLADSFIEGVRKLLEEPVRIASLTTTPLNHTYELPNGTLELQVHRDPATYSHLFKLVMASHGAQYPENEIKLILAGPLDGVISGMLDLKPDQRGAAIEALAGECGLERLADTPEFRKYAGAQYPEYTPLYSEVREALGAVWGRRLKMSGLAK